MFWLSSLAGEGAGFSPLLCGTVTLGVHCKGLIYSTKPGFITSVAGITRAPRLCRYRVSASMSANSFTRGFYGAKELVGFWAAPFFRASL